MNRLANALLAAGLGKGDKFTTVLGDGLELMAAYWAAAKTGIVIVPASPLLQEAGLATLLHDSDTGMVLAHVSFADTLDRIRGELPSSPPTGTSSWVPAATGPASAATTASSPQVRGRAAGA